MTDPKIIQSDFDTLASIDGDGWNHNNHYHSFLLEQIPPDCERALEIGCGKGAFSRCLSRHAESVLALDLSPKMIRVARQRSTEYPNIEYRVGNALTWDFPEGEFDCIVSIATLHHLPLENILQKMKIALKSGGMLMVLDLYKGEGPRDWIMSLLAFPMHTLLKLKHTGRLRESEVVRAAWAAHGAHDTYLPVSEVRRICRGLLPGAIIRKHLLWRYSIVWKKI